MRIYIKTAPYKNNSYAQHLIEHLVLGGYGAVKSYFSHAYGVQATSWLNYSSYFLPPILKVEEVLNQFFSPLDMSILQRERKMIKEELSGSLSDTTILVNRIGKELYGNNFGWAQYGVKVSQKILQFEHQKYYTKDNLWITDDDFVIVQRPSNIRLQAKFDKIEGIISRSYKIRRINYFSHLLKDSPSAYVLCYFLDWIMNVRGEFSSNYVGKRYESPVFSEFFEYSDHLLLLIDENTKNFLKNNQIDSEFFDLAKARFLETNSILQEIALIIEIRNSKKVDILELKKYILSLQLSEISNFLLF